MCQTATRTAATLAVSLAFLLAPQAHGHTLDETWETLDLLPREGCFGVAKCDLSEDQDERTTWLEELGVVGSMGDCCAACKAQGLEHLSAMAWPHSWLRYQCAAWDWRPSTGVCRGAMMMLPNPPMGQTLDPLGHPPGGAAYNVMFNAAHNESAELVCGKPLGFSSEYGIAFVPLDAATSELLPDPTDPGSCAVECAGRSDADAYFAGSSESPCNGWTWKAGNCTLHYGEVAFEADAACVSGAFVVYSERWPHDRTTVYQPPVDAGDDAGGGSSAALPPVSVIVPPPPPPEGAVKPDGSKDPHAGHGRRRLLQGADSEDDPLSLGSYIIVGDAFKSPLCTPLPPPMQSNVVWTSVEGAAEAGDENAQRAPLLPRTASAAECAAACETTCLPGTTYDAGSSQRTGCAGWSWDAGTRACYAFSGKVAALQPAEGFVSGAVQGVPVAAEIEGVEVMAVLKLESEEGDEAYVHVSNPDDEPLRLTTVQYAAPVRYSLFGAPYAGSAPADLVFELPELEELAGAGRVVKLAEVAVEPAVQRRAADPVLVQLDLTRFNVTVPPMSEERVHFTALFTTLRVPFFVRYNFTACQPPAQPVGPSGRIAADPPSMLHSLRWALRRGGFCGTLTLPGDDAEGDAGMAQGRVEGLLIIDLPTTVTQVHAETKDATVATASGCLCDLQATSSDELSLFAEKLRGPCLTTKWVAGSEERQANLPRAGAWCVLDADSCPSSQPPHQYFHNGSDAEFENFYFHQGYDDDEHMLPGSSHVTGGSGSLLAGFSYDYCQPRAYAAPAMTTCLCEPYYDYVSDVGARYASSGGCLEVDRDAPWCVVSNRTCLLEELDGSTAAMQHRFELPDGRMGADCDPRGAAAGCSVLLDVELLGDAVVVDAGAVSQEECCGLCQTTSMCVGYVYHASNGSCAVKTSVTGTRRAEGVSSGISAVHAGDSTCPRVYAMPAGTSIYRDIPPNVMGGALTPDAVCCFNQGLEDCTALPGPRSLLIPCPSDSLNVKQCDQATGSQGLNEEQGGSDAVVAVAVSLSVGTALALALCFVLFVLRRRQRAAGAARFANVPALEDSRLMKQLSASPVFDGKYEWAQHTVVTAGAVVLFGTNRVSGVPCVVKFFMQPEHYAHERDFFLMKAGGGMVPDVYDMHEPDAGGRGGLPCIVMERGDHSVESFMAARALNTQQARTVLRDLSEALHALHLQDIVHGDVKPSNFVWSSVAHRWKVIDFGTWSKAGDLTDPHMTLRYAAPEVARASAHGESIVASPAADAWSLGVCAWRLFTGLPLFPEGMAEEEVLAALTNPGQLPTELDKGLLAKVADPQGRDLITRLLQRDPKTRLSVFQLHSELQRSYYTAMISSLGARLQSVEEKVDTLNEISIDSMQALADAALVIGLELEELVDKGSDEECGEDRPREAQRLPLLLEGPDGDADGRSEAGSAAGSAQAGDSGRFGGGERALGRQASGLSGGAADRGDVQAGYESDSSFTSAAEEVDAEQPSPFGAAAGAPWRNGSGDSFAAERSNSLERASSSTNGSGTARRRSISLLESHAGGGSARRYRRMASSIRRSFSVEQAAAPSANPIMKLTHGGFHVLPAPLTMCSAMDAEREPVMLVHQGGLYTIRVRVAYGRADEQSALPIKSVDFVSIYPVADEGDKQSLQVHAMPAVGGNHWEGVCIWDSSLHTSPSLSAPRKEPVDVELLLALQPKTGEQALHVKKRLKLRLCRPEDPFALHSLVPFVRKGWQEYTPDWAKGVASHGVSMLIDMSPVLSGAVKLAGTVMDRLV